MSARLYLSLAILALVIGAGIALSGCADMAEIQAAKDDYALSVLRHEKAILNGWVDHPTQIEPPPEFNYEPAKWYLKIVDDEFIDTFCPLLPSQHGEVVACTNPVSHITMFRRSYSTPLIEAIAAQHKPPRIGE